MPRFHLFSFVEINKQNESERQTRAETTAKNNKTMKSKYREKKSPRQPAKSRYLGC